MPHPRRFRFGIQLSSAPSGTEWAALAREAEDLGYSTLFMPDHFGDQLAPMPALAAAAAATRKLRIGPLVLDNDYKHPVVTAKEMATLDVLSGGRLELGIGAGWMESDYREAGLPYDRPAVRIERLGEALEIIRSMWTRERTSFAGRHYTVREVARAAAGLDPAAPPKILIGGGGRRVLELAGAYADIVGINPKMEAGRILPETPADLRPERTLEKVRWVREAAERAGRNPDEIELNALVFVVALTDDPKGIRAAIAKNTGMSEAEVADCPMFLTGPAPEIRERLEKRRAETGISYVVIQGDDPGRLEQFAEEVAGPLSS